MFQVLRDCDSEICRGADHEFPTAASQVTYSDNIQIECVKSIWRNELIQNVKKQK